MRALALIIYLKDNFCIKDVISNTERKLSNILLISEVHSLFKNYCASTEIEMQFLSFVISSLIFIIVLCSSIYVYYSPY